MPIFYDQDTARKCECGHVDTPSDGIVECPRCGQHLGSWRRLCPRCGRTDFSPAGGNCSGCNLACNNWVPDAADAIQAAFALW